VNNRYQELFKLTELLRNYNRQAFQQYTERTKSDQYETDFYNEVKPFADKVQQTADEWKPLATQWALNEKPKYVYPIQLKDAHENITIAAVLAFQKDAKEKRLIEMFKSIDYVLEAIVEQLRL
jgi:hypothetical protein